MDVASGAQWVQDGRWKGLAGVVVRSICGTVLDGAARISRKGQRLHALRRSRGKRHRHQGPRQEMEENSKPCPLGTRDATPKHSTCLACATCSTVRNASSHLRM